MDHLTVIIPKGEPYRLSQTITVYGLREYISAQTSGGSSLGAAPSKK